MADRPSSPTRIVVGITGASGAIYARRVIELLCRGGVEVHVVASDYGRRLCAEELGMSRLDPAELSGGCGEMITLHSGRDLGADCASGSFVHDGMVVVPCSSNTLAKISLGITDTLVQRAAMVTLKERRRLVLAHRESPIGRAEIEAMQRATDAGAIVAPLSPGFYLDPGSVDDLVDFMAARLLDLVGVEHGLAVRWDEARSEQEEGSRGQGSGNHEA
ncbi:MAG: UbiX family flavin prenyltransferase [Phycisphaerales bacterium]|nr:UbiX family flavin prenyltransferase [Phycisphaerales bacterium]